MLTLEAVGQTLHQQKQQMAMNVLVNAEKRKLWVVVQHAMVYKAFAHHSFLPPIPLFGWQSRYCDHFLYFFAKPLQQSTTD